MALAWPVVFGFLLNGREGAQEHWLSQWHTEETGAGGLSAELVPNVWKLGADWGCGIGGGQ